MKDLWERLKRFYNGQDRIDRMNREFEQRMEAGDAHAYNRDGRAAEAWRQADAMLKARDGEGMK